MAGLILPDVEGFEVLCRKWAPGNDTPVLVLSGPQATAAACLGYGQR